MNIIICTSAFANNRPSKPNQGGRSHCLGAGTPVGAWRAITRAPQTNRLHNSAVINNHWGLSPHPK